MKLLHLTLRDTGNPVAININRISSIYVTTNMPFHNSEPMTKLIVGKDTFVVYEDYEEVLKMIERISE